ncbi:MAG: molybdopterin cofactor-binding domain-containing protein, partial [Planctomycetota bacterium]
YTTCYGTAGVGTGSGASAPFRALYDCEKFYTSESDVFTNASPGAAFRAPGHPQGIFALEQAIDELAYKLQIDPLEFRKMNTKRHEARQVEYQIGAERFGWSKRNPKPGATSGPIKRGVGVANSLWYYIYGVGFQASIKVHSDGSVELTNGVQDLGTGIRTVIAMIVAEELGLKVSEIVTRIGDTTLGYGPASGGSQTTAGLTPAVRNAAYLAKRKMLEIAAPLLNVSVEELDLTDGRFVVRADTSKNLTWKQVAAKISGEQFTVIGERSSDYFFPQADGHPYAQRGKRGSMALIGGVQFAEIEVDTETGVVRVQRMTAVHDCGHPMNRLTTRSQIQGGIIQGISYALFEDRILDRNTGLMVNPNFEQYKMTGALDVPPIDVVVLDEIRGINSTSAKGIGEPATVPTAAAIANAFYHATGVRIRELPMTPENVLAVLESAERGGK